MAQTITSPRIAHVEWGKLVIADQTFRDAKLFSGGVREWNWRETNTHHVPGVQRADVEELVANGCEWIVLSRGMELVLQVPTETVTWLEQQGLRVEVLETRLAVARYNELAATERVGALIHSTC